jgi:hypothetical protein
VHVPVPLVIVNVGPILLHTPALVNETGNPELAVAATVNVLLKIAVDGALVVNVIV